MNNKAQVQHVFIYILTIVVVGLIFLMGYKVIGNIIEQGCEAEHIKFTSDILRFVEQYDSYESYHTEQMSVPCEYEQLCFVDSSAIYDSVTITSEHALIKNSVEDGIKKNIFLIGESVEPLGFNEKVSLDNETKDMCFNATAGYFNIAFRGDGESTLIETY